MRPRVSQNELDIKAIYQSDMVVPLNNVKSFF